MTTGSTPQIRIL